VELFPIMRIDVDEINWTTFCAAGVMANARANTGALVRLTSSSRAGELSRKGSRSCGSCSCDSFGENQQSCDCFLSELLADFAYRRGPPLQFRRIFMRSVSAASLLLLFVAAAAKVMLESSIAGVFAQNGIDRPTAA
jgi:hypothetical protein